MAAVTALVLCVLLTACGREESPVLQTAPSQSDSAPLPVPGARMSLDVSEIARVAAPSEASESHVTDATATSTGDDGKESADTAELNERTRDWDYLGYSSMLGEWSARIRCGRDGPMITFTRNTERDGVTVVHADQGMAQLRYGRAQRALPFNRANATAEEQEMARRVAVRDSFQRAKARLDSMTLPEIEKPTHQQRVGMQTMVQVKAMFEAIEEQMDAERISEKDLSVMMMAAEHQYRTLTRLLENETSYR